MNPKERLELIKRNVAEIVTEEQLKEVLKKKNPVVYLGTAITGRPHVGYYVWVLKLGDFLKAGFKVKVLLADLHGALDNCPWENLEKRYIYYENIIPLMFKSIGIDTNNLEFVKGSSFQLKKDYIFDVLKMSTFTSVHDATKAASEVVKLGDNPKLSGIIYPLMQALDEIYLDVDVQYGGIDQRKIMVFARENLPKLGYKPRVEVMTPLIPGLIGKKMSASVESSKIDLLDSEEIINKKINGAECIEGNPDNGLMAFLKNVIMVIKQDNKEKFVVNRPEKYGGKLEYKNYEDIEKDFISKKLHPLDLKNAVANELNKILKIFRDNKSKLDKFAKEAYD
ncbi:MAG: tyrosine--tRNA ligase [Nanoarchaeota archaeon]|nr:tyrosine--tRNA ligase [Nanoarchaeota archaeon]